MPIPTVKKISEKEIEESSESITVNPTAVPQVWEEKVDLKQIFLDIFKKHKILFKTTKQTSGYYPKEISFYHHYKEIITEKKIKERGDVTLRRYWTDLENNGDIILYDKDRHEEWFKGIPSLIPFSYRKVNWIARGARILKDNVIDPSKIKGPGINAKSMLYIYNKDGKAKQYLIEFIEKKIADALGKQMAEAMEAPTLKVEAKAIEGYLESFEKQIMFGSKQKYNLRMYALDIQAYMQGRLERVCRTCGYRLFTPRTPSKPASQPALPGSQAAREEQIRNDIQEIINNIDPNTTFKLGFSSSSPDHPNDMMQVIVETKDDQAKEKIINAILDKYQKVVGKIEFNPATFPQLEEKIPEGHLELEQNGGQVGFPDLDISYDEMIYRKYRYAGFYAKNSRVKAWSKAAIDGGEEPQENLNDEEFRAVQDELENELYCPACMKEGRKKLMLKTPFYKTERFINQFIDAIEEGLPVIFTGYPGDGKSSLAECLLRYATWRYGYEYEIYNISEATTAGKLTGRLNMMKIFQPTNIEITNAMYGIIALCLFKKDWSRVGLGRNLMLDEFNRCEFKQISFVMSFLADPYQFVIDDDNYRNMPYPNRRNENKRWLMLATMNTEDINNEDISIAAKGRFAFIEVKYSNDDLESILGEYFNIDSIKISKNGVDTLHPIIDYLMQIYQFTIFCKDQTFVRFPAGVRHLIRIHEIFEKVVKTRTQTYSMQALLDWKEQGNISEKMTTANLIGDAAKITSDKLVEILDEIVRANLLMAIKDENSPARKKGVDEAWEETKKNLQNSKLLDDVVAEFK